MQPGINAKIDSDRFQKLFSYLFDCWDRYLAGSTIAAVGLHVAMRAEPSC